MEALSILFVCIGNTCRSPMAESIMNDMVIKNGLNWKVDSAGLMTWNVGRQPEERCIQVLGENGLTTSHIGRIITTEDFYNFDYILAMDNGNLEELQLLANKAEKKIKAKIELLGSYIGREEDVIIPDPYFSTGISSFRHVFLQIAESCQKFIQSQNQCSI